MPETADTVLTFRLDPEFGKTLKEVTDNLVTIKGLLSENVRLLEEVLKRPETIVEHSPKLAQNVTVLDSDPATAQTYD